MAALVAALAFVVAAPYYIFGHRYFPALERCEYYHDSVSSKDWESWSYVVSPVLAGAIVYLATRALGRSTYLPALIAVGLVFAALVAYSIHVNPNCPD